MLYNLAGSFFIEHSPFKLLDSFQKVDSNSFFFFLASLIFASEKGRLSGTPHFVILYVTFLMIVLEMRGRLVVATGWRNDVGEKDEQQHKGSSPCCSILPVVDTCTYTRDKLFGITYTVHTGYKTGKIWIKLTIYINSLMVTYCGLTDNGGSWSKCTRTYYFLQLYVSLDI